MAYLRGAADGGPVVLQQVHHVCGLRIAQAVVGGFAPYSAAASALAPLAVSSSFRESGCPLAM